MGRIARRPDQAQSPPAAPAVERTQPMFPPQPQAAPVQNNGPIPPQPQASTASPPPVTEMGSGPVRHQPQSPAYAAAHVAPETGMVTVTWGEEMFQPRAWHAYRVGPFTISAPLLPKETVSQAITRLSTELEIVVRTERARKHAAYMAALAAIDQQAASSRPG